MAVRLGIAKCSDRVLTGRELAQACAAEVQHGIRETRVYARVMPAQKITLVQTLQESGEFVAMIGDGVNDAPTLKRADIQELAVCLLLPWVVLIAVEIEKGLARRGWIYATSGERSR